MTKELYRESAMIFFINIGPSLAKSIPNAKKSHLAYMGDTLLESIYLNK